MLFTIFLFFIIALGCILIYLMFAPLMIEIDSQRDLYRLSIVPMFSIWWETDEFFGHPEMNILGYRKKFDLFHRKTTKAVEHKERKKHGRKRKISFHKIVSVIKSFRIKKWLVNIDTGDMALNGQLYPFMYLLSVMTGKEFYINFRGKNEVVITIQNNAFRMLRAFIK